MIWHLFSLCVAVLYHEIINMCKVNVSLDLIALIFISEVKHITLPGNSQIAYIQNFRVLKKIFFFVFSCALLNLLTVKENQAEKLPVFFISLYYTAICFSGYIVLSNRR